MNKTACCRVLTLTVVLAGLLVLGCEGGLPSGQPLPTPPDSPILPGEPGHGDTDRVDVGHPDSDTDPPEDGEPQPGLAEQPAGALTVGRNEAWYFEQGYADGRVDPPPVVPADFPSPTPRAHAYDLDEFDHHVFLPLLTHSPVVFDLVEARALWVTRWDFSSRQDVETLMANAAGAGFNLILFQVRGTGDAFYTPGLEPWAARLNESRTLGQDPGWDPLQTAVGAAHAHGLQIHAYLNVYPTWFGGERPLRDCVPKHLYWELSERYFHPDDPYPTGGWRVYTSDYKPMPLNDGYLFATPGIVDMDEHLAAVAKDIVSRYAVDGVHLDYIRYPGSGYSYDPTTEAALAEGGISRPDWQRQRVTELVSHVYSEAMGLRPGLMLSASVWPTYKDHWGWGYSQGYSEYYQDSQGWLQAGVIDAVLPMIYPGDVFRTPERFTPHHFELLVSDFLNNSGGRHVFPGISAQYDNFDEIAHRIAIARDLGAPGHAIFSARLVSGNYECEGRNPCHDPYWYNFAAGPYVERAQVPAMSWQP